MKLNLKIVLLSLIVLFLIVNISVFTTLNKNRNTILEDVKLKEEVNKNNTFAMMIEQRDGTYTASESNTWPTDMKYNSEKSGCIDNYGNKIENALTYDRENNLVTVSTQGTSYCYLYFDLDKTGPIITNALDAGEGKITFTVIDELNEISEYCVNGNITDTSDCTWYDAVEGTQTTGIIITENGDYYVHVSDSLGNIGHSSVVTMSVSKQVGEYLLANPSSGLNTSLEGGLYRFQGTSPNNYICFGTSTKSTCTGNTDQYMYRIIGINSSGQLKLIKKEALNTAYAWNSSTGVSWNTASIYTNLNASYFYSNTTYVPTAWQSKIAKTTWKYGDIITYNTTASAVYTTENGWTSTVSNYIGLMYMHDYYYAYQSGGLNCSSLGDYATCKTAWLHLSVNDSGAPSAYEWTMSRYSSGPPWAVISDGYVSSTSSMTYTYSVRPVFYLTSDVEYVSGTGASTDPFIVK